MEIYKKNMYEYVLWEGNVRYDLNGEWSVKDVVRFIKAWEDINED